MPEIFLFNNPARVQAAVELLRSTLIAPASKRRRLVMIETDTARHESAPLRAEHNVVIADVRSESSWITIVPQLGLEISLPVSPIVTGPTLAERHQTHIDHNGSFVHIVAPFYYYEDMHRVDFKKWCFVILPDQEND